MEELLSFQNLITLRIVNFCERLYFPFFSKSAIFFGRLKKNAILISSDQKLLRLRKSVLLQKSRKAIFFLVFLLYRGALYRDTLSTEVHSIEMHSIEIHSIEVHFIEVPSIEIHSIETRSVEVRSIEVFSIEVSSTAALFTEVHSIEARAKVSDLSR